MAFGLLSSKIPIQNKNSILYTSSSGVLVDGKLTISHKNFEQTKIKVGISTNGIDSKYIVSTILERGETYESENIYFGNGQSLIIQSSLPNTNFVLYGEEYSDTNDSVILKSVVSTQNKRFALYTAPIDKSVEITAVAVNLGSLKSKIRLGITTSSVLNFDSSQYIEYNESILPNESYTRTNLKLSNGQTLVYSSDDNSRVSFVVFGKSAEEPLPPNTFSNLTITNGPTNISGNVNISGIITATSIDAQLSAEDVVGNLPDSVSPTLRFRDNQSPVGVARTLSANKNLNLTITNGIANLSVSESISIDDGASIGGPLSVGSTINALNNKVINVGTATSDLDAANKKYVDTRAIVMAIALS
jgi:hypothetical protein